MGKKHWLIATMGAFACSFALGASLLVTPGADAANDQVIFEEEFSSSTLDSSVWNATGDISVISTAQSNNSDTLADWQTNSGVSISGETATISGGGVLSLPVSSSYSLTFNYKRGTHDPYSLYIGMGVADTMAISSGAWMFCSGTDQNSNLVIDGQTVTATYAGNAAAQGWTGQDGAMTLTVVDGVATLTHAVHGVVYKDFAVGKGGYVSFYVVDGAKASTVSNVRYVDNSPSITENYKVAIGTEGGTLTSNAIVPGYDARLGWDGATVLEYAINLSGLGTATFTAALGDLSVKVSPDGGRYILTMYDGNEEMALSSGNTNPSFLAGDAIFSFTVRQNGGFSINFNGLTYTAATAAVSSPYGAIKFSVSEGAESAIVIDNISLQVDSFERGSLSQATEVTETGFDGWTKSDGVTVSGSTATISSGGYISFPVSGNYSVTFNKVRSTTGATALDAGHSLYMGISVAEPAGYTAGTWFVSSSGNNSNLWIDGSNVTTSYTTNSWLGQDGKLTLVVNNGTATLTHASHGTAYSNFSVGTSGYVSFYVPTGAGDATVSNISITYNKIEEVPDTASVYHTFEDEDGLLYYAPVAQSGDTLAFSSIAPATNPTKAGYTFAGWTKGGQAVGETVDNTADATYKPAYKLGQVTHISSTLEGDIGLNFHMNIPSEVKADATAKLIFTVDGESQEQAVNATGKHTVYLAAQDYAKDVTMTISTTAGEAISYTTSLKAYIEGALLAETEEFAKFRSLALAIQDYCTAAEDYFNAGLATTDKYPDVTAEVLKGYQPIIVNRTVDEGVEVYGLSVLMESKNSLRYYFKAEDVNAVVCKVDGVVVAPKSTVMTSGSTYYYVEVADIAAQDLDKVYTIAIGSHEVKVSALTYVYVTLDNHERNIDVKDAPFLNAVKSLYIYNQEADAYFNPAPEATAASYWDDDSDWNNTFDFVLNVEEGRDIRVLQLTDIQVIDSLQQRYDGRLHSWSTDWWKPQKMYDIAWKYTREAVAAAQPDLIVLSGDNNYGEFDDDGTSLKALIREMDSYGIPWTLVWGNHDNETHLGTVWMNAQYAASKYCRFTIEDSGITGSGNFTIGVVQGGKLTTSIFCVDSNGHTPITGNHPASESNYIYTAGQGIQQDQINWIESELAAIKAANNGVAVESIGFTHHPLYGQKLGLAKYGYTNTTTGDLINDAGLAQNLVIDSKNNANTVTAQDGDFGGFFTEPTWTDRVGAGGNTELALHNVSKAGNLVGWFFGHIHCNSASVLYDGVRYTNGLKASLYDDYEVGEVGGTLITMGQGSSMSAQHLYTAYDTSTRP